MFRGRIDGQDLANVHTFGKILASTDIQADLSTSADGLILESLSLDNAAASHVFVGGRFPDAAWKMWRWDESQTNGEEVSEGSGADITGVAQSTAASNQAIMTADQNDGWVIGADRKFSTIILDLQDEAKSDITDEFSYWNGSSWTALAASDILCIKGLKGTKPAAQGTNLNLNDGDAPAAGADMWGDAQELLIVFSMPLDWAKTTTSTTAHNTAQGGVDSGYYALRWRNTDNAPGAGQVATLDTAYVGCATRLVIWSLADITTGESLNMPMTSSDEVPWLVYELAGAHKIAASVQVSAFNGKLGEGSKG